MSTGFQFNKGPLSDGAKPRSWNLPTHEFSVHQSETTQRFVLGTRYETWDGREYVYSKSAGACISGQGAEITNIGYTAYTAFGVAAAIGDTSVTVPAATHAALAEDELAGGYICIFDGSTNNTQFRGIVGNEASVLNVAFIVYLDEPLTEAVVATTSACETYKSPYDGLQTGTSDSRSKAGVPAVKITAADVFFWVQKKGQVWVAPQGGVNDRDRGSYWRHDGSLQDFEILSGQTIPAGSSSQYAGYLLAGEENNIGPLFMLRG